MSLPTNLFIDSPEMQDVSMHQLGSDIESWPEEVVQKLKERVPKSAGMSTVVKFMKKDDENGVATGSVVISTAEKSAVVPLVIKDFMLYPLDVFIADSKLLPLTPDYFDGVFSSNNVFDKIEEFPTFGGLGRFEDANLWNAIYPPSLGRYAYASAGYPLLDEISEGIDGGILKKALLADGPTAVRYAHGPHKELITKVANLKPVNMNEFRQGIENLIPRSIAMLKKNGPNNYNILTSPDGHFHPGITAASREDAERFISEISDCVQDHMNEVDQNGEKLLAVPEHDGRDAFLAREDVEEVESCDEFDHYVVKNQRGVSFEGVVIPKVINFDQSPANVKIFLSRTMGTVQPDIWGVRVENSRYEIPSCEPRVGQTGCFVYQPDKSHALATIPVTIRAISGEPVYNSGGMDSPVGGSMKLHAHDLMGMKVTLKINSCMDIKRIAKVGDNEYHLPGYMKWVPMESFDTVSNSPHSHAVKVAGARLTDRPVTLIPTGYHQYSMRGVDKYAHAAKWDPTNLERHQAHFLLTCLGASQEKIAHFFKRAHRAGSAEIHGLNFIPTREEKVASAMPLAKKLHKTAESLRANLIKEASYIENSQTVDSLLSLNFVNPENISKFIGKIPQLKASVSCLASCLIASRLGLQEIPEEAASTSMTRLIEVINGLERLRASQEIGGE